MGGETGVIERHCDDFMEVFVEDGLGMSVSVVLNREQIFTIDLWTKLLIKL